MQSFAFGSLGGKVIGTGAVALRQQTTENGAVATRPPWREWLADDGGPMVWIMRFCRNSKQSCCDVRDAVFTPFRAASPRTHRLEREPHPRPPQHGPHTHRDGQHRRQEPADDRVADPEPEEPPLLLLRPRERVQQVRVPLQGRGHGRGGFPGEEDEDAGAVGEVQGGGAVDLGVGGGNGEHLVGEHREESDQEEGNPEWDAGGGGGRDGATGEQRAHQRRDARAAQGQVLQFRGPRSRQSKVQGDVGLVGGAGWGGRRGLPGYETRQDVAQHEVQGAASQTAEQARHGDARGVVNGDKVGRQGVNQQFVHKEEGDEGRGPRGRPQLPAEREYQRPREREVGKKLGDQRGERREAAQDRGLPRERAGARIVGAGALDVLGGYMGHETRSPGDQPPPAHEHGERMRVHVRRGHEARGHEARGEHVPQA
ncbi:hypothetical protein DFJ74DRAFT_686648 [Hyaloraphidium curvatum]|nr:hypothetical protein DFJ74DRAFT_686648 [Hyaloraphidium curvatum]